MLHGFRFMVIAVGCSLWSQLPIPAAYAPAVAFVGVACGIIGCVRATLHYRQKWGN